jgi:hypothetical protein
LDQFMKVFRVDVQSGWWRLGGTKFWVRSDNTGPAQGARLVLTRIGSYSAATTVWRPPDSVGSSAGQPQFYPGLLQVPEGGQWRLDVSIGPHTGCFLFTTGSR